jgi:monoamine oxidase
MEERMSEHASPGPDPDSASYPHTPIDKMLRELRGENRTEPKKILIIGAGAAGLVAGIELEALGHEVTIFEARDRIGGRVLTRHFEVDGKDVYNEIGAMRIAASHDYVHHYYRVLGLEDRVIPFINSVPENFLDLHGTVCRVSEGHERIYPQFDLSDDLRTDPKMYPGGAIFGWLAGNVIKTLTPGERASLFAGRVDSDRLHELANTSLGAFFDARLNADAKEMVGSFTSLSVWWDKAVTMFMRDMIVGTGNDLTTLSGGMSQLVEGLASRLAGDIHLSTEVKRITVLDHGVDLGWIDAEGQQHQQTFDTVLCTIPFAVLRRMTLENLSVGKMRAIRDMAYAAATKVLLACRARFWQSNYGIFAGGSTSDLIQRQTYYPMDQAEAGNRPTKAFHGPYDAGHHVDAGPHQQKRDDDAPGVMIGAYAWGRDARRLAAVPEEERAEVVMNGISRFHPEIRDYVVDSASIDWEAERFSAGAFAFLRPGQLERIYPDARKPEGRLFFAGEHCSTDQAWIQGSMISALEAVYDMLRN